MKPILFNTQMIRSIIDGRKTVTRRIVKTNKDFRFGISSLSEFDKCCQIADHKISNYPLYQGGTSVPCIELIKSDPGIAIFVKSPIIVGDILYVRETWCKGSIAYGEESDGREAPYVEQDNLGDSILFKEELIRDDIGINEVIWEPSIFMPTAYARIFLKVIGVRCERLKDINSINHDDILKEGWPFLPTQTTYNHSPLADFISLWDNIAQEENRFDSNPWVWVIEFEKCDKPRMEQK